MKTFILIAGLIGLAGGVQAQQSQIINDFNSFTKPMLFPILPIPDSVKAKNALAVSQPYFPSSVAERFYSNMPVAILKGDDKMPVYYSATNDRMVKYLNPAKKDSVKNYFFVPAKFPTIDIPPLPGINVR